MLRMFSFVCAPRLRRLLPLGFVWLLSLLSAALVWGQESRTATPFDELNGRLHDAADRLIAVPVSSSLTRETTTADATRIRDGSQIASLPQEAAPATERRVAPAARVQRLRPVIDPILRAEGIPAELVAVALVESGGRATALSPKGARGIWQLMPETARRYGLIVSAQRDDRLDIVSATRAAARYLRDLHALFGDWELALAAYNTGEQAVQNAIQRAGSNSFAVLSQLRLVPAETRNYVPDVMRARNLFKTTIVGDESASFRNPPNAGRPAQNFAGGKVFYAMNGSDPQVAADGTQAQLSASSITE